MKPTADYAQTPAFTGESEKLPLGGHICQIRGARCETTRTGKEMLVVAFDIHEGSQSDNFYKRRFDRNKANNPDAKWPGLYYSVTTNNDGKTNPMFKGLITAIEESNPGYIWNWAENSLNGKLVGFNFGEEEYVHQATGEIRTSVKPQFPASVARVKEGLTPPALKKLNNSSAPASNAANNGFAEVDDEELPF